MKWRRTRERELEDEIAAHFAMAARDLGSPSAARKEFGSEALVKEVTRSTWRFAWADRLRQDLRYGARTLGRSPGFAAVVVFTLALGIGANTAIFSVMRVALDPIAMPHPDRAVVVWSENPQRGWHQFPASVPDYRDWRDSGIFSSLAAFDEDNKNLRAGDRTERVSGVRVTREVFDLAALPPRLGRLFRDEDFGPSSPPVAILSDAMWRTRFAADGSVIGRSIVLDGAPHTVVGVLPRNFPRFGKDPVYTPLVFQEPVASDRGSRHFSVAGRLRDGIGIESAQKRLDSLSARIEKQEPASNAGIRALLQPYEEAYTEDARELITILFGAVGFVLLIACANIASLVLARGTARGKEMTIRAALGASRWQLGRQLLTESLLLAVLGGLAAILPAWGAMQLVASFEVEALPNTCRVALNGSVLAFNLALSLATGILFGLMPAWQARRIDLTGALKGAGRSVAGGLHQRFRAALVVAEIALTLVLLVGAGLMVRTLVRLRAAYPGYQSADLLTMKVALADRQYAKPQQQSAFFAHAIEQAQALPGVRAIGAIDDLPGSDTLHGTGLHFPDRPEPRPGDTPIVLWSSVTGSYFRTMQIPLLRGRYLTDADREGAPLAAVIDDWTAKKYWPNQDAVGRFFSTGTKEPVIRVVGVVGNVDPGIFVTMLKGHVGQLYFPAGQKPKPAMALVVRTVGDPAVVGAAIRDVVRHLDVDQPVFDVMSMDAVRAAGSASQQLTSLLLSGFAMVALLLAGIGIYGVMSYNVGQRTREFGIRMSLGAAPGDVLAMVARGGARLAAIGIGIGLAGAFALTRLLDGMLYGVKANDPATFAGVTVLLAAVALGAAFVPARRATRVDPVLAMREE
jgi:putative ABC transport system permease protein